MSEALKPGWCADVLSKCDALKPFDNHVSALVCFHHMSNNRWSEASDLMLHGLACGFPGASSFAVPLFKHAKYVIARITHAAPEQTQRLDDHVGDHLHVMGEALVYQATYVR